VIRLAALLACLAGPAAAACLPAPEMRAILSERFGERPVMRGLSGAAVVEVWVGPSGTWTVLVLRPDGAACILADGTAAEAVRPPGQPV
jgi:hypothetical protein